MRRIILVASGTVMHTWGQVLYNETSSLFSFGHTGAYDYKDDVLYLHVEITPITDIGDADTVHG